MQFEHNRKAYVGTYAKNVGSRIYPTLSLSLALSSLNALFHATLPAQILQKSFREEFRRVFARKPRARVLDFPSVASLSRHVAPVKPRIPLNLPRLEPRAARRCTRHRVQNRVKLIQRSNNHPPSSAIRQSIKRSISLTSPGVAAPRTS